METPGCNQPEAKGRSLRDLTCGVRGEGTNRITVPGKRLLSYAADYDLAGFCECELASQQFACHAGLNI